MKIWDSLTDEAQGMILVGAFLIEWYLLFVVAA